MLEADGVSSPGHFALILISLPLTCNDCLYDSVLIYHSSQLPLSFCLPCILPYPSSFSPLNPLSLSSSYYDRGSALACLGPSAHQAFLMLLHSAAAAREAIVSSFPLSHCGCDSCSCLQGSSVCRQPPSEVKSHRDYSLIPGDFKIFLRDDVRHVKSRHCRQERKCGKIKAWRKTAIVE